MVEKDIRKPFWWYTALTFCWVSWVCKTLLSVIMLYPKASLKIAFNLLHVRTGAGSLSANTAYSAVNAQSQLINGVF